MNQRLNLVLSPKKNSNTILSVQRKKIKSESKIEEELIPTSLIEEKPIFGLNLSDKINLEMGFSSIIEYIIESKKPIVGHYLILDILFVYQSFIDDLPEDYIKFKNRVKIYSKLDNF